MTKKKHSLTKSQIDYIRRNVPYKFAELYCRASSHIPCEVTSMQALHAFVREEDIPFVLRSKELYGHIGFNPFIFVISDFPNTSGGVSVQFRNIDWVPPKYLNDRISFRELSEEAVSIISHYVEQALPFYEMRNIAYHGWNGLCDLCGGNLHRMFYLWPTLQTLFSDFDLSLLPRPIGVQSLTPDLRRKLETATTFINTVLLMPEERDADSPVTITLR